MQAALQQRQCQVTGLTVDRSAERQIMAHAVTAVAYLALGGVLALLVVLTRWQAIHLLPAETFYIVLSNHGTIMLIFWILFFEMAGLMFGSTVLLSARNTAPMLGWVVYGLMLVGSLLAMVVTFTGQATVMFTAYPPLRASPWYYLGIILFAVGAILGIVHFFVNIVAARRRGEVGSLPLFTFALLAAAIIGLWSLLSGAAAIVWTFVWSLGLTGTPDPGIYRLLFWGLGHGAQQVNLAAMIGVWYALGSMTTGAKPLNEGFSRGAIVLYVFFIQMAAMHHLLADPGLGTWVKNINVSYFMYAAVMGSLIHAFSIPASIERALRDKGFGGGLFTWLRRAPWGEPGFSALVISLVLFGVMGGISGVIIGSPAPNLISHNTLLVPAHFHMTVVAGTTLAFMGMTYYLVPLIFQRQLIWRGVARIQPYLYGGGMVIWGMGTGLAGHWGVPRRHWDITFAQAPSLRTDLLMIPQVDIFLALLGIGGMIAVLGGALFVLTIVGTLLAGLRTATPYLGEIEPDAFRYIPAVAGGSEAAETATPHHGGFEVPGTLVLAVGFLVLFVFLYGFSWYELSTWNFGLR